MVFNLRSSSFSESKSVKDDPPPPKTTPPTRFSLKEIRVATRNFSSSNILGDDEYGKVYRGRLADGSLVAIQRACCVDQWREELFEAEMQVGSTISMHPNVLCLRGFFRTEKERLLVYPLINNSLSYTPRERPNRFARPLNWTTRKRIALGAARGLAYLHNQGNIRIMHRDICASNILLNMHFEAVIGGFSLAMIMHERNVEDGTTKWPTCSADSGSDSLFYHRYEDVYVNTPICGTFGFIAPEFIYTRKCTVKNDVFAYGNMLLELISGQLIYSNDREIFCLDDWTRKQMNEDQLRRVIDPNLKGNYVEQEAEQLVRLALLCAHEDPSIRPEMSEVVRMLESQFLRRHPSTRTSCNQK